MKILANRRIVLEEFPDEEQKWLPKLLSPLNAFLEAAYTAFAGRLTIEENLTGEKYQFKVQSPASGNSTLQARWEKINPPTVVLLGQVTTKAGLAPTAVVGIIWTYANKEISITLTGLAANTEYVVNIVGIV